MIPVDQDVVGPRGRCFSACLASLLEVPLDIVPSFLREAGDTHVFQWAERLDAWLAPFGLYALHFSADPARGAFPGCYHIITGISPRGRPHACIGWGSRVVHDPHPDKTGLATIDGFCLLVPRWERAQKVAVGAERENSGERLATFQRDAEQVLEDIAEFRARLDPRDLMLVQIGLHASHMEEAIVAGDELRARAHLGALVSLVGQLRARARVHLPLPGGPLGPKALTDLRAKAAASLPIVPPYLDAARDRLDSLLAGASIAPLLSPVAISFAGARRPDGSYVDTRPPGRGLIMEGERREPLNAVEVSVEDRVTADRIRSFVGSDEIMGVPIVYSVRQEWSKMIPQRGHALWDDELPGWG